MESLLNRIVVECGVDHESRPMLAIFACNLPNPKETDMNGLLDLILSKLREYVENDYIIVFFNSPIVHKPSIVWMIKAYRGLNRTYRKNLKRLIVVHPTFWVKVLMDSLKSFISPKFGKKLTYVKSLSEVANIVPLRQIELPRLLIDYNESVDKSFNSLARDQISSKNLGAFFGQPLKSHVVEGKLVKKLDDLLNHVKLNGSTTVGIFRRSPSSIDVVASKKILDESDQSELDYSTIDIHVCAVLIKMFIRDLPEPIFPMALFLEDGKAPIDIAKSCMEVLDDPEKISEKLFFNALIDLIHVISKNAEVNRMNASNLAIVFAPNMIKTDSPAENLLLVGKLTPVLTCIFEQTTF